MVYVSSIIVIPVLQCFCLCVRATSFFPDQVTFGRESNADYVRIMLHGSEIISDVIDDFKPSILLSVDYPSTHESASLGNTVDPDDVQSKPIVLLQSVEGPGSSHPDTLFTVILTDPDAPSRENPEWSEMCHWIATNFTLTASLDADPLIRFRQQPPDKQQAPAELVEYLPPSPPPKTGPHRYAFLVFRPKDGHGHGRLSTPDDRKHWGTGKARHGVRQWANENDLIPVGECEEDFNPTWHLLSMILIGI
ncbi:MAG: hypothetical protein M1837_003929 [Sclerophora amabilis]|nr:MAG: hypothetical protein M1837_003929 [Sclerophora amabilis]